MFYRGIGLFSGKGTNLSGKGANFSGKGTNLSGKGTNLSGKPTVFCADFSMAVLYGKSF